MIVRTSLCLWMPLVLWAASSSPSHAQPASAAPAPITASPGDPAEALPVEARCPTFSWAISPAAESYDLVVYELGTSGEEPTLRLRQHIPAAVGSWTPDLTRCLERGIRYAWAVRAAAGSNLSPWSPPRQFTVAEIVEPTQALARTEASERLEVRAERDAAGSQRTRTEPGRPASTRPSNDAPRRLGSAGTIPNKLTVSGAVSADLFNGSGSGLLNVDADTVDGLDANSFALAGHGHDASQIGSGLLADARIPAGIARDSEVAAGYLPLIGGSVGGDLGVGTGQTQARLHVEESNIVLSANALFEDDLIVEDLDAVLGIYSSTDGAVGSAIVLGESPKNSLIYFEKWGIVRETSSGGKDLRFTFGSSANYRDNPIKFEIGNDGELTGKGIPRAFGIIDRDGTVLVGSEYIESVIGPSDGASGYRIKLTEASLNDCSKHPIVASVREPFNIRTAQYECSGSDITIVILDSLGRLLQEQFSFVVY